MYYTDSETSKDEEENQRSVFFVVYFELPIEDLNYSLM